MDFDEIKKHAGKFHVDMEQLGKETEDAIREVVTAALQEANRRINAMTQDSATSDLGQAAYKSAAISYASLTCKALFVNMSNCFYNGNVPKEEIDRVMHEAGQLLSKPFSKQTNAILAECLTDSPEVMTMLSKMGIITGLEDEDTEPDHQPMKIPDAFKRRFKDN